MVVVQKWWSFQTTKGGPSKNKDRRRQGTERLKVDEPACMFEGVPFLVRNPLVQGTHPPPPRFGERLVTRGLT